MKAHWKSKIVKQASNPFKQDGLVGWLYNFGSVKSQIGRDGGGQNDLAHEEAEKKPSHCS
jgi:hypothetical protein